MIMVYLILPKNLWFRRFRRFDYRCCNWFIRLLLEIKTCEVTYPFHCFSFVNLKNYTIFHQNLISSLTFFGLNWANKSLYIWYSHYTHKDAGNKQFDPKKPIIIASNLNIMVGCFCWLLFTLYYLCNLLFIIEVGRG